MEHKAEVFIAGIGQFPAGEQWESSLRSIAITAMRKAIVDSGNLIPQILFVGNIYSAAISKQAHLGALLADNAGFKGIEAATVEAGGASGGAALRQGYLAITSGLVDIAMVVGVEKITDMIGTEIEGTAATQTDSDYESVHGMTPTTQAALITRRYLHEYHVPTDGLVGFVKTAHANAMGNINAYSHKAISLEDVRSAELTCDPLTRLEVAPVVDGAAALVLTNRKALPKGATHPPVRIVSSAIASDQINLASRSDPLWFSAAQVSAKEALDHAGRTSGEINLFEYDDAYPVYAALELEAAGFAGRGMGWKLAMDGSISLTGRIPCATMGGSKARGNPGGATGIYQAVEASMQLRDQAGSNQVENAKLALIQNVGGPAMTVVTHLLAREV